ncbi:MAG: hypothetical protein L0099_07270 [Acidobacteria bacterium]|nr:hypothetical protein [Acidobacteriota bacterium]
MSISDRRDILVKCRGRIEAGEWLFMDTTWSSYRTELSGTLKHTLIVAATTITESVNRSLFAVPPFFVALTGSSDGTYHAVVDVGFVGSAMLSGASGPGVLFLRPSASVTRPLSDIASNVSFNNTIVGLVAQSDAGPVAQLRVFKRADVSNIMGEF